MRHVLVLFVAAALLAGCDTGGTLKVTPNSAKTTTSPAPCPEGMVAIPAGTFTMGSAHDRGEEQPPHKVKLSAYCMDKTEVTVADYRRCTKEERNGVKCAAAPTTVEGYAYSTEKTKFESQFCNGDKQEKDKHPINCVDWTQADAYCKWVGGYLPSEAQWEYAARGTDGRKYPWGNEKPGPKLLNACGGECAEATAEVGKYPDGKSPFGVLDMAGNVSEWVADWYGPYPAKGNTIPEDPKGPDKSSESHRVMRGGSWATTDADWVRAAARNRGVSARHNHVGFRCARGVVPVPSVAPAASVAPVASGTSTPLPRASAAVDEPPAGLVAARRTARGLFLEATLEADHKKARELFLQAAEALPPGGPSLYQAGRMAALDGDTKEARRLFDRAVAALARSTHVGPRLTAPLGAPLGDNGRYGVEGLAASTSGRFLLFRTGGGTAVYDTFGFGLRFASEVSGDASALSNDGTLVVLATGSRLLSCSLVEASCAGAETLAKVVELALSTDGETLAARMKNGAVDIRDATTLAVRSTFRAPQGRASAVACSPAGDQVFVGVSGGAVLRVRADNGQVVGERRGHTAPIVALAVDPSGEVLASADARAVRVGSPSDAQGEVVSDHDLTIQELAFSPDGKALFIKRAKRVDIWSVATRTSRSTLENYVDYRIALAPGRLYMAGGWGTTSGLPILHAYEMPDPERFDFKSSKQMLDRYGMAPSEKWLRDRKYPAEVRGGGSTVGVADGYGCQIPWWDVDRGVFLRMEKKDDSFKCLNPPRVSSYAVEVASARASVDDAGTVRVGPRAGPFREIGKLYYWSDDYPKRDPRPRIALSPKGALVGFRTGEDRAEIWEIGGDRPAHVVKRAGISGIVFGADETAFVSALDGSITMVRAGEERTLLAPDGAALIGLKLLRGGRLLAAGADDAYETTVYVYSTEDGVLRATLTVIDGVNMRRPSGDFLMGLDGRVKHTPSGAFATSPSGPGEVFGPIKDRLGCRFGPFVFGLDLCHDRLVKPGLLARMLSGERIDP